MSAEEEAVVDASLVLPLLLAEEAVVDATLVQSDALSVQSDEAVAWLE